MSGIKRETIIRVILGICMIFVSIGMIYGKSKAGNADEKGRTYIEESEKTAKQKKTEKKAAEKKAAKKEKEERLKDKKSDKVADSKEEAGTEDTVTISAGSIEELLSKIETYNFNTRSDSVQTADERQVGQNFDFRG